MIRRIIVGISGASGVIYGCALVRELVTKSEIETHLVVSKPAEQLITVESASNLSALFDAVDHHYQNSELGAPIASGSFRADGMVIIPCSMSTIGAVAHGIAPNLITRAAAVCLKEKRPLIVVPRETPLNLIHLENMCTLARGGALVLPAMPAFYHNPETIDDLVHFIVGKVLDSLAVDHALYKRWGE